MHIYQPVDLVLGVVMFPLGLWGMGQELSRVYRHSFKNTYGDWRTLGLSVWFLSGGPAYISKAFDQRHQESHLTSILQTIELFCLCFLLVGTLIAFVVRKCQRTQEPLAL